MTYIVSGGVLKSTHSHWTVTLQLLTAIHRKGFRLQKMY